MRLVSLFLVCAGFSVGVLSTAAPAFAHEGFAASGPDGHAPLGVMGDHTHNTGEWMFSYRYMHMSMQGNRSGDERISADEIVTTQANPFFGAPMQPPTLRVVPTEMNTDMHMLGAMYAPADWLTVMVMSSYTFAIEIYQLTERLEKTLFMEPISMTL